MIPNLDLEKLTLCGISRGLGSSSPRRSVLSVVRDSYGYTSLKQAIHLYDEIKQRDPFSCQLYTENECYRQCSRPNCHLVQKRVDDQ